MKALLEVIALAHEYSLETRVRRLVDTYGAAGTPVKTLVMHTDTLWDLMGEQRDPNCLKVLVEDDVYEYKGLIVLLKDEVPTGEVVVGV